MSEPVRLRLLFIGTDSPFALVHLQALAERHEVVAILQSVRRLKGLTWVVNRLGPSRLRHFARQRGIPFEMADRRRLYVVDALCARYRPDIGCIASMAGLMPAEMLDRLPLGFVNVHPAKLPEWRGPYPVFWQLLEGRDRIGVTVHRLAPGEDDGPILRQGDVPVRPGEGHGKLMVEVARQGADLLTLALDEIAAGTERCIPQPLASPTPRARKVGPRDVHLLFRPDLPIERCASLMAALGGLVVFPWPRLRDLGWLAQATGRWRDHAGASPRAGTIGRNGRRWFLAHPAGQIDLVRSFQPRRWVEALRSCRKAGLGWMDLL